MGVSVDIDERCVGGVACTEETRSVVICGRFDRGSMYVPGAGGAGQALTLSIRGCELKPRRIVTLALPTPVDKTTQFARGTSVG